MTRPVAALVLVPLIRAVADGSVEVPLGGHWALVLDVDSHRWGLGAYLALSTGTTDGATPDDGGHAGLLLGPVGVFLEPRSAPPPPGDEAAVAPNAVDTWQWAA